MSRNMMTVIWRSPRPVSRRRKPDGGFYAHFESRDALLAAAADQAGAESIENLTRGIKAAKPGQELLALIDTYLSDRHVAAPEQGWGCAIAAAGSEVPVSYTHLRAHETP